MKKQSLLLSLLAIILLVTACQKEFSLEAGGTPSIGSLQDDAQGECLPKTVVGAYEEGVAISGTANYIEVEVDVIQAGSYVIYTDTINGVFFRSTGTFTTTGTQLIKLPGSGTPAAAGVHNFVVSYGTSQCTIAVTTLPPGGGVPAEIELVGSPGNCTNFQVLGTYVSGTALNSSNQIILEVNVLTIGTYTISTVLSNGIVFSAAGSFGTPGPATITLTGSGTPVNTGPTNIPVTIGTSSCSFSLDVIGQAVYTIDCGSAVPNGVYTAGVEMDASNTVTITVDVTTLGGYNISGTVNGITFSASAEFTTTGPQPVTLAANGIPSADGNFNVQLNAGTTPCSFDINVNGPGGGASGNWSFKENNVTYSGSILDAGIDNTTFPAPAIIFYMVGQSTNNEIFQLELGDMNGTIDVESYSGFSQTVGDNLAAFFVSGPPPNMDDLYLAHPTDFLPNSFTATITSHDIANKTVTGTFSGEVQDAAAAIKTITDGQFTVTYP